MDLGGQLAGWHQDKRARLAGNPATNSSVDQEALEHGKSKRRGLARAGLRSGHKVLAAQNDRNGLTLD
jgi:hypothetical protein